jgi:hypothetical protein
MNEPNQDQMSHIESEVARAIDQPTDEQPQAEQPPRGRPFVAFDRNRAAMRATDSATEHAERSIEAAVEEAIISRIVQMRGKLDIGPRDVYARQEALKWIMSITSGNGQDKL